MPNKQIIRTRLVRLIGEHAPIARSVLEKKFATSTRKIAQRVLSDLLSENYIALTGLGRRGSPITVVLSAGFPKQMCPLCGHIIERKQLDILLKD